MVNLKRHHRELWDQIDEPLIQRYQSKATKGCFADVKPSEAKKTLSDVASDLYRLVTQFDGHRKMADMSTYKLRILNEQREVHSDGTIDLKLPKQIRSDSLQNPSDPDTTYSGHDELQADSLYGSGENCQQAKDYELNVVSPTMGTEKQDSLTFSDFEFRCDGHVANCPSGHCPVVRKKKKTRFSQGFDPTICSNCPRLEQCPVKSGKGHYYLRYDEKSMRLARRRQHETTQEFK